MSVSVNVSDNSFTILNNGDSDSHAIGYISNNTAMNEIIYGCREVIGENGEVYKSDGGGDVSNDDVIIITKLFARTLKGDTSVTDNTIYESDDDDDDDKTNYELSDVEKIKVQRNPYKYASMIDHFFSAEYQSSLENNDAADNTIPWLLQSAKNYHINSLETQSNLLSYFNSTLAGENKKKEDLLDIVNNVEEQSKHRLQTRNRLSFINKDQIERMLFKNDFIRRTLFYLCLIIFVAFLSQLGLSKFMTNALCFILFVTWVIHSFIMYNTFNTRHNLQFRMKVYSGDMGDISKNNIKYKNTDRCPNDDDDDDKPKGKC